MPYEKKEVKFVSGLMAFPPNDKAPDFIKANLVIDVVELGKWLKAEYAAGNKEKINCNLNQSKKGSYYVSVNDFKPQKQDDSDVPF